LGRLAEAEAAYREALKRIRPLVDERPDDPPYRRKQSIYQTNLGNVLTALGKLPEAETEFRNALEIQEQLVRDFPDAPEYQTALAGSYCNFGILLSTQQRPQDALPWYAKAIRLLEALLERDARLTTERLFLRNSHWSRASALTQLNRYAEALGDWDRAIELSEEPDQPAIRLERALTLARLGDHARAVSETDDLTRSAEMSGAALYDAACVCGLSATAAKEHSEVQEQYALKALALLRRAQSAGFFEDREAVEHLQRDDDLAALRDREDFKKLVIDLEAAMRTM
jgi:tetratricopeptide (TPR) repeat protein